VTSLSERRKQIDSQLIDAKAKLEQAQAAIEVWRNEHFALIGQRNLIDTMLKEERDEVVAPATSAAPPEEPPKE
jgi:hypothetical protein